MPNGVLKRVFFQVDGLSAIRPGIENQIVAQAETGTGGYYLRNRMFFRTTGNELLGPKLVFKGGKDYQDWQAGLAYGGLTFSRRLQLVLRAGLAGQKCKPAGGYAGAEMLMTIR